MTQSTAKRPFASTRGLLLFRYIRFLKQRMKEQAITLTIGDRKIPAVLNHSNPSRELLEMLPVSVRLHKYAHDYCGVMTALSYDDEELRSGWSNGDIAFVTNGNYFAILYKDEEISQQYGNMVTLGRLAVEPAIMDSFANEISVVITVK